MPKQQEEVRIPLECAKIIKDILIEWSLEQLATKVEDVRAINQFNEAIRSASSSPTSNGR